MQRGNVMKVYFEFDDRKAGLKIIAKNYLY